MSSYPINGGDNESLLDAVNYAVSGPSGFGQQTKGFRSTSNPNGEFSSRLTGNYRVPYSNNDFVAGVGYTAKLYVEPIALGNSYWLDDYTYKHEFATPQAYPPFSLGNNITIEGVTPSDYDGTYRRIGVVECSTTYVIARYNFTQPNPGVVGTGGTASLWVTSPPGALMSTDANGIISVDAGNSLVTVTGQLEISDYSYAVFTAPPSFGARIRISVDLNRYKAFNSGTAANPVYFYEPDATIASQTIADFYVPEATQGIPSGWTITGGTSSSGAVYTVIDGNQTETITGVGAYAGGAFDIVTPGDPYVGNATFTPDGAGGNYAVGDEVLITGDYLGGITPDNDLTMEVASITGTGDVTVTDPTTVIFTPVIDNPDSGLYWYIIEVNVFTLGDVAFKYMTLGRRSLTAQVLKK